MTRKRQPAYILATVLVLLGVSMFGVGAIITVSTLESKISRSQQEGSKAYYAAEAGVESALWQLNNNSAYSTALAAGNLNVTYSATNRPDNNQNFAVSMVSTSAGYATLTISGTYNNGSFTAARKVVTTVFSGPGSGPTNGAALMSGGLLSISNGSATTNVSGGGVYATGTTSGGISINNSTVNIGTNIFESPRTYVASSSTVTSGGINASNYQPAGTSTAIPGFDFTYYSTHYNTRYTPAQFITKLKSGSTVNIPGPVTYVSGDVDLKNNVGKNTTINITGMLIINGSLTTYGSTKGMFINVADPGNGKAGVFFKTNFNNAGGTWNVNGTIYSSGTMNFTKTEAMTINGALIGANSITLNPNAAFNLTYNATRLAAVFGTGTPGPVQVSHWEEDY